MKKITIISLIAALFLVGCGGPELLTYNSDTLGLTFEYPSKSFGESVSLQEELSETGEIGEVSLMVEERVIASLSVEMIDSPTGGTGDMTHHLWTILLSESEACAIEEVSITDEKEIYGFDSLVYPFGDEFDSNCLLTSKIYYFPEQVNKVVVVDTGKTEAFEVDVNPDFLDSVKLLP